MSASVHALVHDTESVHYLFSFQVREIEIEMPNILIIFARKTCQAERVAVIVSSATLLAVNFTLEFGSRNALQEDKDKTEGFLESQEEQQLEAVSMRDTSPLHSEEVIKNQLREKHNDRKREQEFRGLSTLLSLPLFCNQSLFVHLMPLQMPPSLFSYTLCTSRMSLSMSDCSANDGRKDASLREY